MPATLTFHFTGRPDPISVNTAEDLAHWREQFETYAADGRATVTDEDGHVVHVNLAHVAYVEMVERG